MKSFMLLDDGALLIYYGKLGRVVRTKSRRLRRVKAELKVRGVIEK